MRSYGVIHTHKLLNSDFKGCGLESDSIHGFEEIWLEHQGYGYEPYDAKRPKIEENVEEFFFLAYFLGLSGTSE